MRASSAGAHVCYGQANGAKLRARWLLQYLTFGRAKRVNPLTFQHTGVVFLSLVTFAFAREDAVVVLADPGTAVLLGHLLHVPLPPSCIDSPRVRGFAAFLVFSLQLGSYLSFVSNDGVYPTLTS